jgi:hypothetical protein
MSQCQRESGMSTERSRHAQMILLMIEGLREPVNGIGMRVDNTSPFPILMGMRPSESRTFFASSCSSHGSFEE